MAGTAVLMAGGCGYRLAGGSRAGFPQTVRTIAIRPFENETFQFKVEQSLTVAVVHAFLSRTGYRIQSEEAGSDAVLLGTVTAIYSSPIVFDPNSGRTTEVLLSVSLRVSLLDTATRRVLYEANDFLFREPYEVSKDPAVYFGENQPALERLSRAVAASLVSTLIENF